MFQILVDHPITVIIALVAAAFWLFNHSGNKPETNHFLEYIKVLVVGVIIVAGLVLIYLRIQSYS